MDNINLISLALKMKYRYCEPTMRNVAILSAFWISFYTLCEETIVDLFFLTQFLVTISIPREEDMYTVCMGVMPVISSAPL